MSDGSSPSVIVRAVWFVFIGSWLSGVWLSLAWFLNLTIIGTPLGLKMINKVPWIVSLKSRTMEVGGDGTNSKEQVSLPIRAVYFVFVGWWVSGLWMAVAWIVSVTIIGLPLAIGMYSKLPAIVSLYRY
ncbi:YccF domain-containing protein [Halobaculum sp. MBLA0143]|uniref:YccF domain-containing protein n=1 Tax=Halobaculum sp. MBLA0143 TaxID=3079933 RepID=UPI003525BB23